MTQPQKNFSDLRGSGASELDLALRQMLSQRHLDRLSPLPSTRDLARKFGISNTTAYRVLLKLLEECLLWRHENGRFYHAEARELIEKPRPLACLLRRLETWSIAYENIMQGFSQVCGQHKRGMLFVHNESLVQHPDLSRPPSYASLQQQRQALKEFSLTHASLTGGVLLDDAWSDSILAEFQDILHNAVVVYRKTSLPFLSNVQVDFKAAALLAVAHACARGYQQLWLAVPFTCDAPVDTMIENVVAAGKEVGCPLPKDRIFSVATPEERAAFVDRLKKQRDRVAVFCPEDNVASLLQKTLQNAGLRCPEQAGLISGMGSAVVQSRNITSVQCDFAALGRKAAEILLQGRQTDTILPQRLLTGGTT
ncbi:MAG: substrate-binding domain-containing protein [Verrucomicrobiae bacterium]|nr:substrate-binding domain-containing protein [Verrucomicrobiae bacterium]